MDPLQERAVMLEFLSVDENEEASNCPPKAPLLKLNTEFRPAKLTTCFCGQSISTS